MNYAEARSLYNDWRTTLLNKKYYACRLAQYRRLNVYMDLLVAIGTSGTIATWKIWKQSAGSTVWTVLAGIVALVAIMKPLLQLAKQIERYSKLYGGYSMLAFEYEQIVGSVVRSHQLSPSDTTALEAATRRTRELIPDDDPVPNRRLRRRCYEEVTREVLVESLWWPA